MLQIVLNSSKACYNAEGPSNIFDLKHIYLPSCYGMLEVLVSDRTAILNPRDTIPAVYAGVDPTKFMAGRYNLPSHHGMDGVISTTAAFRDNVKTIATQLSLDTQHLDLSEITNLVFNRLSRSRNTINDL